MSEPTTTTLRPGSASASAPGVRSAGAPAPAVVDADAVAAAALACPEVAALSGGTFGEVATYLPGRRVAGVRIDTDRVDVHVVARYGAPLHQIADRVRRTVAPTVAGLPVNVTFDDITTA